MYILFIYLKSYLYIYIYRYISNIGIYEWMIYKYKNNICKYINI